MNIKTLSAISLIFATVQGLAFDYESASGFDIVRENDRKDSGFTTEQIRLLQTKQQGKMLTFCNGVVSDVSKEDDLVVVRLEFSKGAIEEWRPIFAVNAKISDEEMAKLVLRLNPGDKVISVVGKALPPEAWCSIFSLGDAKLELSCAPSDASANLSPPDAAKLLTTVIEKQSGKITTVRADEIFRLAKGRTFSLTNGIFKSAQESWSDKNTILATISFDCLYAGKPWNIPIEVTCHVTDPSMREILIAMDRGRLVESVSGVSDGTMFTLKDAKVALAEKGVSDPAQADFVNSVLNSIGLQTSHQSVSFSRYFRDGKVEFTMLREMAERVIARVSDKYNMRVWNTSSESAFSLYEGKKGDFKFSLAIRRDEPGRVDWNGDNCYILADLANAPDTKDFAEFIDLLERESFAPGADDKIKDVVLVEKTFRERDISGKGFDEKVSTLIDKLRGKDGFDIDSDSECYEGERTFTAIKGNVETKLTYFPIAGKCRFTVSRTVFSN